MNKLVMKFETSMGDTYNVIIPYVKEDVSEAEVKELMDSIIAQDIFFSAKGTLTGKKEAKLVKINESEISIA